MTRTDDLALAWFCVVMVFAVLFAALVFSGAGTCTQNAERTSTRTTGSTFPQTEVCE